MICLDTNLLIFGLQKKAALELSHEAEAAAHFLQELMEGEGNEAMIPPIVLTEYLQGFPDPRLRSKQYEILAENFFIPSFDAHAAKIAADIAVHLGKLKAIKELSGVPKLELRADIQIIATALANNADTIITFNLPEYRHIIDTAGFARKIKAKWVAPVPQRLFPGAGSVDADSLN